MADTLTDLVARLRAAQPALADVPDDVLTAEVLTQLQARGGPSVGDALEPDYGYGFRYNSREPKGQGYLGTLKRPIHAGERPTVMGEYSIPLDEEHGDLREIPSMVPTLTREEVQHILLNPEGKPLPPAIVDKAQAFARQRLAAGLPVFARAGEQQTDLYPELPRDTPTARPQAPPMMASHTGAASVGDVLGAPTFRTTNEKDAGGAAVARADAVSPWTKAATIGAPGIGERYAFPSVGEVLASDSPLQLVAQFVTGHGRPRSVANADPLGVQAFTEGKGPMPMFMGSTEEVGDVLADVAGSALSGRRLGSLAKTIRPGEAPGVYELRDPVVDRLHDLYRLGTSLPSTANWEGSGSEELINAFGGDRAAALRWARMWGATSPNTSVPVNTRESVSALIHALENPGVPFTETSAQNLPNAKITMAGSKFGNLNAALEGRVLSPDMKAEAMAGFMAGEPRIPIDVHALYALGSKATKFDPEISALRQLMTKAEGLPERGGLTNPQIYRRYEDALRGTLQEFEPNRSVNQVFAELWEGARAHKGLKPQGGPIDILRKKGLLELGAMLDPERLRVALSQAGWTASAIAGVLAALETERAGDAR